MLLTLDVSRNDSHAHCSSRRASVPRDSLQHRQSTPSGSTASNAFGLSDSQDSPVKANVADMTMQITSTRDCELRASATSPNPETARFRSTKAKEVTPIPSGNARKKSPLARTKSSSGGPPEARHLVPGNFVDLNVRLCAVLHLSGTAMPTREVPSQRHLDVHTRMRLASVADSSYECLPSSPPLLANRVGPRPPTHPWNGSQPGQG